MTLPGNRRYGSSGATALLANPEITALLSTPPAASTFSQVTSGGVNVMVLVSPITQGATTLGSVMASYNMAPAAADQRRVVELALIEAGIALLAAVLGGYLLLRRLLGTIGRMTSTARTIEEGDLDQRLGDQGTDDEVGELAATFDAMLDRIDEVLGMQRRLLADVSHQLKTPLTVIRGHLEVLARTDLSNPEETKETIEMVVGEVDHMRQLTEQLLLLGHSLERGFLTEQPVDVRAFAGDIVTAATVLGEREFLLGEIADLVICVDEAKLRGAVLNLIDNAVKATKPGDQIELAVTHQLRAGNVALTVGDAGPGIAPEKRAVVLSRFGRPDDEVREGTGLGLAIVGAVAEAHGGRLEIGTSRFGGLAATILLPNSVVMGDEVKGEV